MANADELAALGVIEILEEVEYLAEQPGRQFHQRTNAFVLSDRQFIKLFRLPKVLVRQIVNMITPHIAPPSRISALDVSTKVLVTLRFLASGSYQLDVGCNIYSAVSQPSVSRCIQEVVTALNHPDIFNTWVRFPSTIHEMIEKRKEFFTSYGFPGVIGCIDCTHVAIIAPNPRNNENEEHLYVNRKNYHSINVQLICDSKMYIMNVNALFPGSTNDAYIWNNSRVRDLMEQLHHEGQNTFYLLGDSGYPLRPWLLTPLEAEPDPNSPAAAYNACHKRTRCIIERCNGLLKMRFRCLLKHRVLHYTPEMASRIVNACVVLHNMCIRNNVPEPDDDIEVDVDFGMIVNQEIAEDVLVARRVNPFLLEARKLQQRLINNHFANQ